MRIKISILLCLAVIFANNIKAQNLIFSDDSKKLYFNNQTIDLESGKTIQNIDTKATLLDLTDDSKYLIFADFFEENYNRCTRYKFWNIADKAFDATKEKVVEKNWYYAHVEGNLLACFYKNYATLGFIRLSNPQVVSYTSEMSDIGESYDIVRIKPGIKYQGMGAYFNYVRLDREGKKAVLCDDDKEIRVFKGHEYIRDIRFFSDGSKMVTVGEKIIIWDVNTGKKIQEIASKSGEISRVAVSPNGTSIACRDAQGRISVIDLATGNETWFAVPEVVEWVNPKWVEAEIRFSPDGKLIAYGTKKLFVFDAKTGETIDEMLAKKKQNNKKGMVIPEIVINSSHEAPIKAIAENKNGTLLASLDEDGVLIIRDKRSGLVLRSIVVEKAYGLAGGFSPNQCTIQFDLNDQWIAVNSKTMGVSIYNLETGKQQSIFTEPDGFEKKPLNAGKKGIFLYNGNYGTTVYDFESNFAIRKIKGEIAFQNEYIAGFMLKGDYDNYGNQIEVWNLQTGQVIKKLKIPQSYFVTSIDNGKTFLVSNYEKDELILIEGETGKKIWSAPLPSNLDLDEFTVSSDKQTAVLDFTGGYGLYTVSLKNGELKKQPDDADLYLQCGAITVKRIPANFSKPVNDIISAGFGNSDSVYYTLTRDKVLRKWNMGKLKPTKIAENVVSLAFDMQRPKAKHIVYATENEIIVHNLGNDKVERRWPVKNTVFDVAFSNTGFYIAAGIWKDKKDYLSNPNQAQGYIQAWNIKGEEISNTYATSYDPVLGNLKFSPKNDQLAWTSSVTADRQFGKSFPSWYTFKEATHTLVLWDLDKNSFYTETSEPGRGRNGVNFSTDGKWLQSSIGKHFEIKYDGIYTRPYCYGEVYYTDKNYNARTLGQLELRGTQNISLYYNSDSSYVNVFPEFSGDGYLYSTSNGYYTSTPGQASKVGFSSGKKAYRFDQFDLQFNRPDLVLEKLGMADNQMKMAYKMAYEKRLRRQGINPADFEEIISLNVPIVKIKSEQTAFEVNNRMMNISIEATDEVFPLRQINIWVNGVPIYGIKGIDLSGAVSQTFNKTVELELSAGKNVIEVSAVNSKGVEGLRERIDVLCNIPATKPDLYILAIGISDYVQDYDLRYAAKDAGDISAAFASQTDRYGNIYQLKFLDKMATRDNILKAKNELLKSKVDDQVIVFVASHGLLDDKLDYYIATSDVDFANPADKGLLYEDLEGLLDGIPARKKLMMIDACHSGEVDKEDALLASNSNLSASNGVSARGFTLVKSKGQALGLANSFELMKEIFADVRRGTGAVVISAAAGKEYAFENDQWKNGAFTYSLLEGLKTMNADADKNMEISLSEMRDYVTKKVQFITGGKQNPTSRAENLEFDFRVW